MADGRPLEGDGVEAVETPTPIQGSSRTDIDVLSS